MGKHTIHRQIALQDFMETLFIYGFIASIV